MGFYTPENPCHGCKERCVGCHDRCAGYEKFLKENEEVKKRIRRENNKEEYGRRLWKGK